MFCSLSIGISSIFLPSLTLLQLMQATPVPHVLQTDHRACHSALVVLQGSQHVSLIVRGQACLNPIGMLGSHIDIHFVLISAARLARIALCGSISATGPANGSR